MLARCVLVKTNDAAGVQTHQVRLLFDEVKAAVERLQNYGFSSHPLPGAEGLVVFMGGGRDHAVTIVVDDRRYRFKSLQPGEVVIYTDEDQNGGHRIHFKRGRKIEIVCDELTITASTKVEIAAPSILHNE